MAGVRTSSGDIYTAEALRNMARQKPGRLKYDHKSQALYTKEMKKGMEMNDKWTPIEKGMPLKNNEESIFIVRIADRGTGGIHYNMIVTEGCEASRWIDNHNTVDERATHWTQVLL